MNRLTFTVGDVVSKRPCSDGLDRMTGNLGPFTGTTELSLLTPTENTPRDLLWGLQLTQLSGLEKKTIAVKTAIFAARGILPLFEAEYPEDQRPRRAIEAAAACVLAEFSEESMRAAHAAAHAAAKAAKAAHAAAWAAKAAEANAAACAAGAAANAAACAAWAAWAARAAWAVDAADAVGLNLRPKIKAYLIKLLEDYK